MSLCVDVCMMCQHPPASAPLDPESEEAWTTMKAMHDPGKAMKRRTEMTTTERQWLMACDVMVCVYGLVLELTHNHGKTRLYSQTHNT